MVVDPSRAASTEKISFRLESRRNRAFSEGDVPGFEPRKERLLRTGPTGPKSMLDLRRKTCGFQARLII